MTKLHHLIDHESLKKLRSISKTESKKPSKEELKKKADNAAKMNGMVKK